MLNLILNWAWHKVLLTKDVKILQERALQVYYQFFSS